MRTWKRTWTRTWKRTWTKSQVVGIVHDTLLWFKTFYSFNKYLINGEQGQTSLI